MKTIINKIKEYRNIIIYRHINPDADAYGSAVGMYYYLKKYFPDKNVVLAGEFKDDLYHLYINEVPEFTFYKDSLGIVMDTANRERIDGDINLCKEIIKIDHHLIVDAYGDIRYENPEASSCSEIVTLLVHQEAYPIPSLSARCLYMGIVGDSNRFLYRHTTQKTFQAASLLLEAGIDIEAIYRDIYVKKAKELDVTKYIYNHYIYDEGIAYYYLDDQTLNHLNITRNEGSNYVQLLGNIEEYKIYMALTENKSEGNIRVSLRSRQYPVNKVAAKFNGGGHALASGATLQSLDELPLLLKELKEVLKGPQI